MGLDIYLYKVNDLDKTARVESQYKRDADSLWADGIREFGASSYQGLSEEQQDTVAARVRVMGSELGVDEFGQDTAGKEPIEIDSLSFPDHLFKIGNFHSSYNNSGLDSILRNVVDTSLWDIFAIDTRNPGEGDRAERCGTYYIPDWKASLARAEDAATQLALAGDYNVMRVRPSMMLPQLSPPPRSAREALLAFQEVKEKYKTTLDFHCRYGEFHLGVPLQCTAIIPGTFDNVPTAHIVYQNSLDWYREALHIVIETCSLVLSIPSDYIGKYVLQWSH